MRNIKLTIMYDGKDFNGWQKQPLAQAQEEITSKNKYPCLL